jgi:F-type H+-transporting ATPase subunit gamma
MANLKEVRNRITSVGSTMQITSAMKMVSAAKLKRAQDAITQMRPYANKLKEILQNLSASLDTSENVYAHPHTGEEHILLVVVSSNRGLAGAFNANVVKKTWSLINNEYAGKKVSVLPIGKKANDAFRKTSHAIHGTDLPHNLSELFDKMAFENVAPVAEQIMKAFVDGQFTRIEIIYNQFRNAAVQVTTAERFLPIDTTSSAAAQSASSVEYIFEPSKEYIVGELIPKSLKIQLYKALLDSVAAEHGARMTAMHKATDNAKEMLRDLKISYNKARQAAITTEILEIVAGAEALKG